jgi:hypothetical protein
MALADVLGRLVVAAPVLLIPTLLLAGCVLAVADETRGDAREGRVR